MAVPKRRMSRANTHSRRSQWKSDNTALQTVKVQGREVQIPRRLVKAAQLGLVELDFVSKPEVKTFLDLSQSKIIKIRSYFLQKID
jgi:large subunit ribosomal protein L32